MAGKKDSEMIEMFNLIVVHGLSPNQFFLLLSMTQGISPIGINIHQDHRVLLSDNWIDGDNKLTAKASELVSQLESFFKVQKKKTVTQLMGSEYGHKIKEYLEIFPNEKLPSGKRARSDVKNLEVNFKWFFENYSYDWDTILKATAMYVDEYELKSPRFMYMRTSQYFIKKMEKDHSVHSELADYCANIESGGDDNTPNHFKEKVV